MNQIHDSVIYFTPTGQIEDTARKIKSIYENPPIKKVFGKELKHVKMQMDISYSHTSLSGASPFRDRVVS